MERTLFSLAGQWREGKRRVDGSGEDSFSYAISDTLMLKDEALSKTVRSSQVFYNDNQLTGLR